MTTEVEDADAGPVPTRRFRHRRSEASPAEIAGVTAIAVAAAVVAIVTSDAAPTGGEVADAVLRGGLAAGCAGAGSRSRRSLLAYTPLVLALGATGAWLPITLAAGAGGFAIWRFGRRDRVLGALIGGVSGMVALNLARPDVLGVTLLIAATALVPLLVSGYRTSRRSTRRRVRIGLAVAAVLVLVAVASSIVFAVVEQDRLRRAAEDARAAAATIGSDEAVDARRFQDAAEGFRRTVSNADSWWMAPARNLPIVGPNVRAIRSAAIAAAEVNDTASRLGRRVDFETLLRDDGSVDVGELELLRAPVDEASETLDRSLARVDGANSPWLLLPLRDRLTEFRDLLQGVSNDATTVSEGVHAVPGLLGVDAPRRYILLLGNPAELRDLGGHIGTWAEVVATNGDIEVVRVGSPYELYGPTSPVIPSIGDSTAYPAALAGLAPQVHPQNWGAAPDLPTVARLVAELYPQAEGGGQVDGVIYADPWAFAGLLELTGPVDVPGTGIRLDSSNAVQFLTRDQYAALGPDGDDVLSDVVETTLDRLVDNRLPSPRRLASVLGPLVDQGHLRMTSLVPDDVPFLDRIGLERSVRAIPGTDLLGVINRNANPSKADAYLRRDITDRITWDPSTGEVRSDVIVALRNAVPTDGQPAVVTSSPAGTPPGTNRTELSILSPFRLRDVKVDGAQVDASRRTESEGLFRYSVTVDLPPGVQRTVEVSLAGAVAPGERYRLHWVGQPLVDRQEARLEVRAPSRDLAVFKPFTIKDPGRDQTIVVDVDDLD